MPMTLSRPKTRPSAASKKAAVKKRVDAEIVKAMEDSFLPDKLRWNNVDWKVLGWMLLMHAGCLAAPFFFTWQALVVALVAHWLTISLGIGLAYHRLLSHKSLKLATPVEFFVNLLGALSGQGSPLNWAATHRVHHAKSDHAGDPHSPLDGKWWSHLLWLFVYRSEAEDEALFQRYIPDLAQKRSLRWMHRWYGALLVGSGVALFLAGGWPVLLWALCVRMTLAYHGTWFVNSATHLWGYKSYKTDDESRNLWWVALLTYGEGWHNNHHAYPRLARAGHRWWEIDLTFGVIRLLQWTGLAREVADEIPSRGDA